MATLPPGEIRINTRTVQIGNAVYPLANISRVRVKRIVPSGPPPESRRRELRVYGYVFLALVLVIVLLWAVAQLWAT